MDLYLPIGSFILPGGVKLIAGYVDENTRIIDHDENATVFSGDIQEDGTGSNTFRMIVHESGEDASIIDGVIITAAQATRPIRIPGPQSTLR
ncbi:MAG: hypothetical protein U5L04_05720 [Trueperaceae bacterium]|nr:hypothetical protein [Trueperaceae bacterium]